MSDDLTLSDLAQQAIDAEHRAAAYRLLLALTLDQLGAALRTIDHQRATIAGLQRARRGAGRERAA